MARYIEFEEQPARQPFGTNILPFYIGLHRNIRGIRPHHHAFAEFTFVTQGCGTKIVNGQAHQMLPGTACLYLPHHIHQSRHDDQLPATVYCCMFELGLITHTLGASTLERLFQIGTRLPSYHHFSGEQADYLNQLLFRLHAEYLAPADTFGRDDLIRHLLTEALVLFLRYVTNDNEGEPAQSTLSDQQIFQQIQHYLHVHHTDRLSLEIVANEMHVSPTYISRLFKKHTGHSFLHYVHLLRIQSATHLLITTHMSIAEISTYTGFESFRTFARVFRKLNGMTPSEYRDQITTSSLLAKQSDIIVK